jgi:di/tricarboxylate transporter
LLAFEMETQQIYLLVILLLVIAALVIDRARPAHVFTVGVVLLVFGGVVSSELFIESMTNHAILSIFLLIILTAGINEHFPLERYLDRLFGQRERPTWFLLKMGGFVTALSSVMNNTPVVALMMPYVRNWSIKNGVSPSRLMMPLSFFAISGGMITLIGTSTNLVLAGLVHQHTDLVLSFSDFLIPGSMVAILTLLFMSGYGYRLLPDQKALLHKFSEDTRQYLVETIIPERSPLIGKNIEEAGLRNLAGVYLAEIIRTNGRVVTAAKPNEIIREGDLLFFAGDTQEIIGLIRQQEGLELSKKRKLNISEEFGMVEAIVTYNSLLAGKTVKEFGFREYYDGAIIGIHRNGDKIRGKIGETRLETGDLLLISSGADFQKRAGQDKNLLLISEQKKVEHISSARRALFLIGVLVLVLSVLFPASMLGMDKFGGLLRLHEALFLMCGLQFALGMMDSEGIKKNVSLDLLMILASALTFGSALLNSGTAEVIAQGFIHLSDGLGGMQIGLALFLLTFLLTSFVTNIAAVSVVFPIALVISKDMGMSPLPFIMITAFGASACFLTPMGYQTNLMVYGPGGYRFRDFLRAGFPLTLLYGAAVLTFFGWKYQLNW